MFLDRARRYKNMYKRIDQSTQEDKPSEKHGWFTSKHNKGAMVDNAHKMLMEMAVTNVESQEYDRDNKPIIRNFCPFRSRPRLEEFISYQEKLEPDANGINKITWGAPNTAHDDCVMDTVIAWKVIRDEFSKISTCNLIKKRVRLKKNKHYLGEQEQKGKAFSGFKKQKSLKHLSRGRGVRNRGR